VTEACTLCGRPREGTDRDSVDAYCSPGCRDVAETLDPADDPPPEPSDEPRNDDPIDFFDRWEKPKSEIGCSIGIRASAGEGVKVRV